MMFWLAQISPLIRSLFFVSTVVFENRAYLKDGGGAIVTRSFRSARKPAPVPTVPVESMRNRFRVKCVTVTA